MNKNDNFYFPELQTPDSKAIYEILVSRFTGKELVNFLTLAKIFLLALPPKPKKPFDEAWLLDQLDKFFTDYDILTESKQTD